MKNGFLQISRSLFEHPSYISAPNSHRNILMVLMAKACFKEMEMDDHGKKITLQPGQLCCTIRQIVEWTKTPKSTVERALKRFLSGAILDQKAGQETGHKKSVFSISTEYLLQEGGTRNGTNSGQTRDTKEERKNEIPSFKKETRKKEIQKPEPSVSIVPCSFLLNEKKGEEIEIFHELTVRQGVPLRKFVIARWFKKWGFSYVNDIFSMMLNEMNTCMTNKEKRPIENPEAWMEIALKRNYIEMGKTAQKNMELALNLWKNGWPNLEVRTRFAVDNTTGKDFMYNHIEFETLIMFEYERVKEA